jgi:hypothetical protein
MIAALFAFIVACGSSNAQVIGGGVGVHNHSSNTQGGTTLNPTTVTMSGTLSSTKACDAGFTRIAPNHCEKSTNLSATANTTTCTQITLPTGAKALHFAVQITVNSTNAVGDRGVFWQAGGNSSCDSFGTAIQLIGVQVREFVATPVTAIYVGHYDVIVPVSAATGQLWQASILQVVGAGSLTATEIRGYFD